jgi:hypothetical protein
MPSNTNKDIAATLGPTLFQILDGLWFIQIEKKFGFDTAMEIDNAVWEIYSRKEGERLIKTVGKTPGQGTLKDLQELLPLSMFNQTLDFKTDLHLNGGILVFLVTLCKTKEGMERVGRSQEQIFTICKQIGLTFFTSFARAINPSIKVECLFCPLMPKREKRDPDQLEEKGGLCGWKFSLS